VAPRRGFRSRLSPGSRRKTAWGFGPKTSELIINGVGKTGWSLGVSLGLESQATVTRIRGMALVKLNFGTDAGDGMTGAMGIGLASSDAFAVGATALPGPINDTEWQWLWHSFFDVYAIAAQAAAADIAINSVSSIVRILIDSKAQRILRENETIFGMVEVASELGPAQISVFADSRMLVKLT